MKQFYLLISLLFLSVGLSAQTFVNASASAGGDGASWATAYNSLDDALANASAGDVIWVAAGTYVPSGDRFMVMNAVTIRGGFNGTESSADEADPTTNVTILSGDVNGNDDPTDVAANRDDNKRIMYIDSMTTAATLLSGLSFTGGQTVADEEAPLADVSGASVQAYGVVHIDNCTFTNNNADLGNVMILSGFSAGSRVTNSTFSGNLGLRRAGAVYGNFTEDLYIGGCTVENNTGERGAMYMVAVSGLTINNTNFTGNVAIGRGPAIGVVQCSNTRVTNCDFTNNSVSTADASGRGGAVYLFDDSALPTDPSRITFDTCNFNNNSTQGILGGAVYALNADFTFSNSTFDGNAAASHGGAIFSFAADGAKRHFVLNGCTINDSQIGGGVGNAISMIHVHDVDILNTMITNNGNDQTGGRGAFGTFGAFDTLADLRSEFNFTNVTFSGNQGTVTGAGLYVQSPTNYIDVNIRNSNFVNNACTGCNGGGIFAFNSVNLTLDSVEASFNTSDDGGFLYVQGEAVDEGAALIDGQTHIMNSVIHENFSSSQGGAIDAAAGADLNVYNSLFYGNSLTGDMGSGGAIIANGDTVGQVVNLAYNTFVANTALTSGDDVAVFTSGNVPVENVTQLTATNNAFVSSGAGVGNLAIEPDADGGMPVITSGGGNFFKQEPMGFTSLDSDIFDEDVEASELFVLFDEGDLVEVNLIPNLDYAGGNPLVDNAVVVEGLPTTDIIGVARDNNPDIGAYEGGTYVSVRDIEQTGLDITFYPNPAQNEMTVSVAEQGVENINITLINMNGQRLTSWALGNNNTIDFTKVPAGIYTLEINIDGQLYSKQVVKQ